MICKFNIIIKDISHYYLILLLIVILISGNLSKTKFRKINYETIIIVEINEIGKQKIISQYYPPPSQVYINEEKQIEISRDNIYDFKKEQNTIKMIWNDPLTSFNSMFNDCSKLTKIEFINLETSNINNMDTMFYGCSSLTSLDLSNFVTTSFTSMRNVFHGCTSLKSINFNNFDTSNVTLMSSMFYGCSSLTSLDLSNFKTSLVTSMSTMFQDCTSLKILNIKSFDTSNVINMEAMFYGCSSLISLDLSNFITTNVNNYGNIFGRCKSDLIYCFNDNLINDIKIALQNLNSEIDKDCSNICFTNNDKKIIIEKSICVNECSEDDEYKLEYHNICYKSCPEGTLNSFENICEKIYINDQYCNIENIECFDYIPEGYYLNNSYQKIIDKCNIKCKNCTSDSNKNNLCIFCNNNEGYYPKYEELANNSGYINCYKNEIDGYFFDNINGLYIKCYETCKQCNGEGNKYNHNCKECYANFFLNLTNCHENCSFYYYYDSENEYHCTFNDKCPDDYNKLIIDKKKCANNCDNDYKYEYNNICYKECPNGTFISSGNNYKCKGIDEIPDGYFLNDSTLRTIDKCNIKCQKCSSESTQYNMCNSCNNNKGYYSKENEFLNYNIDCYSGLIEGYFLDNISNIYRKCYQTCKECKEKGNSINHNCTKCYSNYILNNTNCIETVENVETVEIAENVETVETVENVETVETVENVETVEIVENVETVEIVENVENCSYYYYFDSSNKYQCTKENECPKDNNKLIIDIGKCINDCSLDDIYKYEYNNTCYKLCPDGTINSFNNICENESQKDYLYKNIITNESLKNCSGTFFFQEICGIKNNNNKAKDELIKNIKNDISHGLMNSLISNLINGDSNDLLRIENDISYQLTSSNNQNNNKYNNISNIFLGECENILKIQYKINPNETLLIFKLDYFKPNSLIPIIGYEIYHPTTKQKLDLKYCEKLFLQYNIPVVIDENNLFKYDPNNEYYNNECIPHTTDNGTDIIINDRQNEYNNNNLSICENNCTFKKYDIDNKKSICECEIKPKDIIISEIVNNNDILNYNFIKKNQSSNFVSMKCYYTLFTKDGILKNFCSYILIFIIILFLISGIIFYKCGYYLLEDIINNLKYNKSKNKNKNNIYKFGSKADKKISTIDRNNKKNKKRKNKNKLEPPNKKNKVSKEDSKLYNQKKKIKGKNTDFKNKIKQNISYDINKSSSKLKFKIKNKLNIFDEKKSNKLDKKINKLPIFNDFELNYCNYQIALLYD